MLQQQVASLQAALTAETNRATAAEAALTSQLGTLQTAGSGATTRLTALETKTAALSASTVAGQPALVFSGVNVYVENGMGQTGTANSLGNLIVGYDEPSTANVRTGSHNLVLGTQNDFSSWGGLIAGEQGSNAGAYATVIGGKGLSTNVADSSIGPNDVSTQTEFTTIAGEINEEITRAEGAEQTLTTNLAATNSTLTNSNGSLSSTQTAVTALQTLTASMKTGVDPSGANAVVFSGVNVYVQNGAGATNTMNGVGNLVVGYNELPATAARGGSHNLVLGVQNNYSSYGGLVAGGQNSIAGKYATVTGGQSLSEAVDYGSVGPNDALYVSDISSLTSNLTSVSNTVNDPNSGLAALDAALATTNNNLTAVTSTVNNPTTGVAALNTSLSTTNSSLATTNSGLATVTATVNDPNSGAAALKADIAATNASLATTNNNLATTNANLATTNANLATTNSNLGTTNSNLASVTTTANSASSGVTALNTALGTTNTNLNNITTTVNALAGNTYEAGMIAHFTGTTCPSGWTALASAQGRYIVGLNPGGTSAGTKGTALVDLEQRMVPQHNHTASDSGHSHFVYAAAYDDRNFSSQGTQQQNYGVWSDAGAYAGGAAQSYYSPAAGVYTGAASANITVATFGDYLAANLAAPYVQYLVCIKS